MVVPSSQENRFQAIITRRRRAALTSLVVVLVTACLSGAQPLNAQSVGFKGSEVKAVLLFNFAQFVVWPEEAFPDRQSAFVIGILGDDPFGSVLDEVVRGEMIHGRALIVERFRRVEDIRVCHILFVGAAEAKRYADISAILEGRPILTVGDVEDFTAQGGAIRLVTTRDRIRLSVNIDAASAARLTISSKLLRSAEIVTARKSR